VCCFLGNTIQTASDAVAGNFDWNALNISVLVIQAVVIVVAIGVGLYYGKKFVEETMEETNNTNEEEVSL
jgi:predicted RND superfamily exporter protein